MLVASLHKLIGELRGEGLPKHHATMAAADAHTLTIAAYPIIKRRAGDTTTAAEKRLAAKIKAGMT